jgi:HlyD family secretion protein
MDFDKFLGEAAAEEILAGLGLTNLLETLTNIVLTAAPSELEVESADPSSPGPPLQVASIPAEGDPGGAPGAAAAESGNPAGNDAGANPDAVVLRVAGLDGALAPGASSPTTSALPTPTPASVLLDLPPALLETINVDFTAYASLARLDDGEAKQQLRKFQDDLMVAQRELEQARSQQEGTRRLFDQGFVTRIDMERDDIALTNSLLKVQTAATAQELFLKYEFAKLAEQSLSAFLEGARELDRARRSAISKMAQADARLKSAQAQYNVQLRHRHELMEQLEKCVIRAEKAGLVVYGGGEERYWRGEEQIREGATVRERQSIITIPDMSRMSVKVKIHESHIKKVQRGQKARVTLDAFPDEVLEGEVTQVAVLPDSEDRWMNPDMKVYRTTIAIQGSRDWLKPGMSAKAEIMVDELPEVLYVPIQAVVPQGGKRLCYVVDGRRLDPRPVEVGQFNNSFIEIKSGLQEGELVTLRPPGRADLAPGDAESEAPAEGETVSGPTVAASPAA